VTKQTNIDPQRAERFMSDPRDLLVIPPGTSPEELQKIRKRLLQLPPEVDGLQPLVPRDAKPLS
jgi:hypothetical protein